MTYLPPERPPIPPERLKRALALFAVAAGLAVLVWSYLHNRSDLFSLYAGILTSAGVALYLAEIAPQPTSTYRISQILRVISFLCLGLAWFTLFPRETATSRPPEFFILLGLSAGALFGAVIGTSEPAKRIDLAAIVAIGLTGPFSQLLVFPEIVGVDPWFHRRVVIDSVIAGHIPGDQVYESLPAFHTLTSAAMILTSIGYKWSSFVAISVPGTVILVLFTYGIGSLFIQPRVAMGAALLSVTSDNAIHWFAAPVPNTLGVILALLILGAIFRSTVRGRTWSRTAVVVLLLALLTVTHSLTPILVAGLLFAAAIASQVSQTIDGGERVPYWISGILLVFVVGWWTFKSGHLADLTELAASGFDRSHVYRSPKPGPGVKDYWAGTPLGQRAWATIGLIVYGPLAAAGAAYMFVKIGRGASVFAVIAMLPMTLNFVGQLTGALLLEDRLQFMGVLLGAIPLTVLVVGLLDRLRGGKRTLVAFLTISTLSVLMVSAPLANYDYAEWTPATQVRFAFNEPEFDGAGWIASETTGDISGDWLFVHSPAGSPLRNEYGINGTRVSSWDNELASRELGTHAEYYAVRAEAENRPIVAFGSTYLLSQSVDTSLTNTGASAVYDNQDLRVYRSAR